MRKLTFIINLLCLFTFVNAQTTIYYNYNNSGSRKHRGLTPLTLEKSDVISDSVIINSLSQDINELDLKTQNLEIHKKITSEINTSMNVSIYAYPIPTHGNIHIEINGYTSGICALYRTDGVMLLTSELSAGTNIISLDKIADGIYFLLVKSGSTIYNWKVIKE